MKTSSTSSADESTGRSSLASSQRLSELALESGQLGSWSLNVATQTAVRTPRHDAIFGYEELYPGWTYSTFLEHVDPRDRGWVDATYRKALTDGTDWEFEARIQRTDGEERWIWAKGKHFRDPDGNVLEIVGLVGDITERQRTEIALRKSEQLAVVGRLASTIAHEMNNPLESVTNLLYLAGTSDDLEEVKRYIATAETELQRVSAITNQTLRFHRRKPTLRKVSARELMSGIEEMFAGRVANHGINVTERYGTDRMIFCFDGEIRQVLTNLVGNAIDAMRAGGRLLIRSRAGRDRHGENGVFITIADTGTGISPEVAKKMYDPFFSTKGANGSGLGLWVSLEIIQRHHGRLKMRSHAGTVVHGTVFSLFLPSEREPEEPRQG